MTLFDLVYIPLAIITAPVWARKARGDWGGRFGRAAPIAPDAQGRPRVMLHAVSVGEVSALRELVPLLTPHADVVVSTTTDTGMSRARDLFGGSCHIVRYPLDFSWSVNRFLDAVKPDAVALVELELWPNFVKRCEKRGVPVCVINGRLSERSFRGYRKIRGVLGATFRRLAFAAVQDEAYAGRFEFMGVPATRCFLTGSMKWDSAKVRASGLDGAAKVEGADELAAEMGIDRARPVVVAGSTGPGEEALLRSALDRLPEGTQLVCAPRKPERFDEAAAALGPCVRRTEAVHNGVTGHQGTRFLLDTIGELRKAYALADVVVVGRSFGTQYGSDPIEPVALGKATVIGPSVSDFAAVVAALERGGGLRRATPETLAEVLSELLASQPARAALARAGAMAIQREQGASVRHAELLLDLATTRQRARM